MFPESVCNEIKFENILMKKPVIEMERIIKYQGTVCDIFDL